MCNFTTLEPAKEINLTHSQTQGQHQEIYKRRKEEALFIYSNNFSELIGYGWPNKSNYKNKIPLDKPKNNSY